MKASVTAPAAVLAAVLAAVFVGVTVGVLAGFSAAPPAVGDPGTGAATQSASPPFIDHTEWATQGTTTQGTQWRHLASLRVYPTVAGRAAARQQTTAADADEAWSEVLALSSNADTPGMRAQFICHWQFAELVQPGKTSWNLEPWRPVVDDAEMVASGCNPGGPEESF